MDQSKQTAVEIHDGNLGYQPENVIYRGKSFKAPVYLTTLLAFDYIVDGLLSKSKERDTPPPPPMTPWW